MENIIYVDEKVEPEIPLHDISHTIQLFIIIIALYLFYSCKRTETRPSQDCKIGDQKAMPSSFNNTNNTNTEVTTNPTMETMYNFCVTIDAKECGESQKSDEENQKLNINALHIRYIGKSKGGVQCDCTTTDDIEKNLTTASSDDQYSHYEHDLSTSFYSRIKVKDLKFQVSFSKVYSHHPLEINRIPWRLMNKEWWRLHTFSKYPRDSPCSSILLARHGFVYIGTGNLNDDTVICVFCLSAAKDLGNDMDIEGLHHSLNSNCPMVKGLDCQNIKIKEYDGNRISYILSFLKNYINTKAPSTISSQQYEDQPLPLDTDSSRELPHSDISNMTDTLHNQECEAHAASRENNNTGNDTCRQANEDNASYVVVTNRAQSLSFPGSVVTNAEASNRIYEAQQLDSAVADSAIARPDNAVARPDSVPMPSPASSSAKPAADRPAARQQVSGFGRDQTRNSQSSGQQSHSNNSNSHTSSSELARNDTNSSQDNQDNSTSSPPQTVRDSQESQPSNTTSYDKLGIITARPKRPEYAVEITRLNSFEGWPQDHHIKAEDLAKAGYFYTGYSDCARCFYCGGGLRNWEVGDDVWVEHARWFPKCAFMRQIMGQPFIDVVQELNKEKEIIPYEDVIAEMRFRGLEQAIPKEIKDKSIELERDAAVITIIDNGFTMSDAVLAAEKLKETGQSLSADILYEELEKSNAKRQAVAIKTDDDSSISKKGNEKREQEMFESLKGENNQLRQQSQCKICMDKEVSVVFLPCGHFISCNDCSFALKSCPVCRDNIKGVVRAYLK